MQIKLFNSANTNHIALRFIEVETEQLVMPWMAGDDTEQEMQYQIVQKIGSTETIVAQGFYPDGGYRLSHIIVDGSQLKLYINAELWRTVSITSMAVNRMELSGGAKKLVVDEMFVAPYAAKPSEVEAWSEIDTPFFDQNEVISDDRIPSSSKWDQAVADASQALVDAADAQATADGKVTTYYQNTEPDAEALGDLWVHTGEDNKLYRWSGNAWEAVQDKKIQEAVQKAEDAQATADGKIVTFYQSSPPTATAVGDLWVDTDDNNHLYRWSGTAWVDVQDKSPIPDERIPSAEDWNRKARTFYQDTPPVASGIGDIWIDTSDYNHMYRWNGTAWRDVNDNSPIDAGYRPVSAGGGRVSIDSQGAFGYDIYGVKRAGFGTDGRWIAGAGAVTADELGLMIKDLVTQELRLHLGNIGGQPWGDGVLAPGTYGLWGDQAGLYLRGYSSFVRQGTAVDEEYVDIGGNNVANPSLVLSLREIIVPRLGVSISTDALHDEGNDRFKIQAKIFAPGASDFLPGHPLDRRYTHQVPAEPESGIYGRYMSRIVFKAAWYCGANSAAYLRMYTNDQFGPDGRPLESGWVFRGFVYYKHPPLGTARGGTFPDKIVTLPRNPDNTEKRYALRFVDESTTGTFGARTSIDSLEYFQGESFYHIDGSVITPDAASGLSVAYTLFQQG